MATDEDAALDAAGRESCCGCRVLERQVRKGDAIELGDTRGVVQEIGFRASVIRTVDNIEMLIPNSQLISEALTNWTRSDPTARMHVPFGVSYDANPLEVKRVVEKAADAGDKARAGEDAGAAGAPSTGE